MFSIGDLVRSTGEKERIGIITKESIYGYGYGKKQKFIFIGLIQRIIKIQA